MCLTVSARTRSTDLSAAQARRIALAAQGFTDPRPTGRVDKRHLRRVFERINVIQVDSVNVLVRSQELPLFARLGPHPRTMLADAIDDGELWEYWAHVAAIVPSHQHRLFRWKMAGEHEWERLTHRARAMPDLVERVRGLVRDQGPIAAGDLEQRVGARGSWWSWDDGKIVLEHLFQQGELVAVRRRRDFARLYDLPERVLPAAVLAAPTPTVAAARKELLALAAASMGVATIEDLADYHRHWRPQTTKPLIAELVEEGVLQPVAVEGWAKPAYLHRDAKLPRAVRACALLSPFDSLVWHRARNERLFDFRYRIEIYTPAPKRIYGYYVLPYLLGDRIVGRVDLKADRAAGVLRVQGAYVEPGVDAMEAAGPLVEELGLMAGWLDLDCRGDHRSGRVGGSTAARRRETDVAPPGRSDRSGEDLGVEVEELGRVAPEDTVDVVVGVEALGQPGDGLAGVRVRALLVGVVRAPDEGADAGAGDVVDADRIVLERGVDLAAHVGARGLGQLGGDPRLALGRGAVLGERRRVEVRACPWPTPATRC